MVYGIGFRVKVSEFSVQCLGFQFSGGGFMAWGLGFRI